MADDNEDHAYASDEVLQRAEDRRKAQQGRQHPLRYQFEGMYEGRPELSGTPAFGRNWLNANIPTVPRFRGHEPEKKGKERERQGYEAGRGFTTVNMFTHNENRSVNTTNNYMGDSSGGDVGGDWGSRGGQFQDAEVFEPMDHDLFNVRERGGGGWAGELGTGQAGIGSGGDQDALGI
jgi:hypothetical protein